MSHLKIRFVFFIFVVFFTAPSVIADAGTWKPIKDVDADNIAVRGTQKANHGILSPPGKIEQRVRTDLNSESGGLIIKTTGEKTDEFGKPIPFTIRLQDKPLEKIVLGIVNLASHEARVMPDKLVFSPDNWQVEQSVTVVGLDDHTAGGAVEIRIQLEILQGDARYSGVASRELVFYKEDNDTAGILVGKVTGTTTEEGGTARFSVRLTSSPQAPVTLPLTSSNVSEAVIYPKTLIFTKNNWNHEQLVVVTGRNDYEPDGDTPYEIRLGPSESKDGFYQDLTAPSLELVNLSASASMQTIERTLGKKAPDLKRNPDPVSPGQGSRPGLQLGILKELTEKPILCSLAIQPSKGEVSERGDKLRLRVKLTSPVTLQVPLIITTSLPNEALVSPTRLVFDEENWDQEQEVLVIGKDDAVVDGDSAFNVLFSVDESAVQQYIQLNTPTVDIINKDDDEAGMVLGEYNKVTAEDGTITKIPLKLISKPLYPVTIELESDSPNEAQCRNRSFTFAPENWNVFQTLVVEGKDDFISDGDRSFSIRLKRIETKDAAYRSMVFPRVALINKEVTNNTNHIRISGPVPAEPSAKSLPITAEKTIERHRGKPEVKELHRLSQQADYVINRVDTITGESGKKARLEVKLTSKPTDTIHLKLVSTDLDEGVVQPSELVFTTTNWDTIQIVNVIGQDDDRMDGDVPYQVKFRAESKRDFRFDRLAGKTVQLINRDNDKAQLIVNQQQHLTTEAGNKAAVSVALGSRPSSAVTIPIASTDRREGIARPEQLIFSPDNWRRPQIITVSGQDDLIADGDITYHIKLGPAQSTDQGYQNLKSSPLQFINKDNDQAALQITKGSLTTGEGGESVKLYLSLKTQPQKKVRLELVSLNKREGIPKPATLDFDPTNWNRPQTVTVIGQDDVINDGDIAYQLTLTTRHSKDDRYRQLADQSIKLINEDNDRAGIWVGAVSGQPGENGDLAVFGLKLRSQPLHNVEIAVSSDNPSEGRVVNGLFHFTPDNWLVEQQVEIAGMDDTIADGNKSFTIDIKVTSSDDPRYRLLDAVSVNLINRDNDKAGFKIIQPRGKTSEDGDRTTFSVALTSKPAGKVSIDLVSNDETEGIVDATSLTFNAGNWHQPQQVTVTGVNDQLVDGEQNYSILLKPAISSDPTYHGIDPADVRLSNLDNNLTTFFVSKVRGNTSESGQKVSFNVRLNAKPKGNVTIHIKSDHPKEAQPDLKTLWFDHHNWDQNQKVTITGFDDPIDDGDIPYQIIITSSSDTDPAYNDIPPVKLNLLNKDDDKAGLQVKLINKISSESGEVASFSIRLTSQPVSSVVLLFESTKPGEGKLLTEHAAFVGHNWNKEQIINIKGMADQLVDGNQEYAIISSGAVSSDPLYNKLTFPDLKFINKDLDEARFVIGEISSNTTEAGAEATFTVRLSSRPRAPVSIELRSDNPQEGTIDKHRLDFDESNWNLDQVVTVTGIDDFVKDDDKLYHIVFSSSVSDDGHFHGLSPRWISLKNLDNKKLTFGLLALYTFPVGSFANDFDASFGYAVTGGYVYNGYVTYTGSYQILSLTGTPERSLYGDRHKVEQTLTLNSLALGLKVILMKKPVQLSAEPFVSLINWQYQSKTLTDGTEQTNQGRDYGLGIKVGVDYALYESLFVESGLSITQLTGGLGDRQLVSLGAGFYLPF